MTNTKYVTLLMKGLRKLTHLTLRREFHAPDCICDRQIANDVIHEALSAPGGVMISRFGSTEMNCINNYLCVVSREPLAGKLKNYVLDKTHLPWWDVEHFESMRTQSGIFPPTEDTAVRFSQRCLEDTPLIDVLGAHQYFEKFMPLSDRVKMVQLEMLYPFLVGRPWTRILAGSRVLVIHPFEQTIISQYKKRELLFANKEILPEFELLTIKAVQSAVNEKVRYRDWFEALDDMENSISSMEFDYAIIGCGAYGLPLAAHVKRLGKKAIHIGGGAQLLFGIKGKRWTDVYPAMGVWKYRPGVEINIDYRGEMNEHWTNPLVEDTPRQAHVLENACYW